ncbi:dTDP-4-dehydrorhamnose 3,5-epimerase family protein [Streptomyces sp. NPDC051773]|uniref:dTDP-4-dehydrorhamnose 3,5-epimerase family protein n=1 Tax=Streptomyces sp. NPDC051773 TaxID=3156682 RepID=UPI0034176837
MRTRELAVRGVLEFTPEVFPDARGLFVSPFQLPSFAGATGGPLFQVAQASHSVSRRGVVRGIHFTTGTPGTEKYVCCPHGEVLDIVVDLRVGSPTFGTWDAVVLDQRTFRALYLPAGVGHAFVSLRDGSVMSYLLSAGYVAEKERAVSVLDPELALPLPSGIAPVLSERDRLAGTLAEAAADGILPRYEETTGSETP